MWGVVSEVPSLAATGTSSVSSAWHFSAHNSNCMVDNEFDMLGTRSRSPMMTAVSPLPSHNQLTAGWLMWLMYKLKLICKIVYDL